MNELYSMREPVNTPGEIRASKAVTNVPSLLRCFKTQQLSLNAMKFFWVHFPILKTHFLKSL